MPSPMPLPPAPSIAVAPPADVAVPLLDPTIASALPPSPVAVRLSSSTRLLLDKSAQFVATIRDRAASMIALFLAAALSLPAPVDPAPLLIDAPPPTAAMAPVAAAAAASWESLRANADVDAALTPPEGETIEDDLDTASSLVWGVSLRAMQMSALTFLFRETNVERKMLLVQKTGSGKTHVIRMAGTMLKGIHLILHPLLVLTADQIAKFASANQDYGQVSAHNLDEHSLSSGDYRSRLIKFLASVNVHTTRTVYVFVSPHLLAAQHSIRNVLLNCATLGTLRSVTLDEAHLLAKQGASFRPEIRMLSKMFFRKLFANKLPSKRPYLLAVTATNSTSDQARLEGITCVSFPPEYCSWASAADFRQRQINMKMAITGNYSTNTNLVLRHLAEHTSSAFVFFNTRSLLPGVIKHLEGKIDQHDTVDADVIQIHGKMDKALKSININIFTGKLKLPDVNPRVLVATSAGDMGVDHPNAQYVLNCEFPEDPSTVIQRRGRASRRGENAVFFLAAGVASYLNLMRRIHIGSTPFFNDQPDDALDGFNNSAVASPKKKSHTSNALASVAKKNALSSENMAKLRKEQSSDFISVLSAFCLNLGCQHGRWEQFCATGVMTPGSMNDACGDSCSICTGEHVKLFLPVSKSGLIEFIQLEDGLHSLATANALIDLVWKNEHWTDKIFNMKVRGTRKYQVEAMFLQLIAGRMISAVMSDKQLRWTVCRECTGSRYAPFSYSVDKNWIGIRLLPERRLS